MPRGRHISKRVTTPDPIYHSELIGKFVNFIMKDGKKTTAENIVYGAFDIIKAKRNENPLKVFETVIDTIRPQVEVRSKRVGGANYQVPTPVAPSRQNALAFRWLVGAAQARKGSPMRERLANEIMDVLAGTGGALKKKEDVNRMAEANKAFAHFARFSR